MSTTSAAGQQEPRLALPRGVTGFRDRRSEPLPETDRRAFATICHEVARATGGRAGAITRAGITPDFHSAVITYGQEQVMLLAHKHAPFLATAAPAAGNAPITFTDDPRIHAALSLSPPAPFRLLTLAELQAGEDGLRPTVPSVLGFHVTDTYRQRRVTTQSTWKKSHASKLDAWACRNCRHVVQLRCGAGGMRSRFSTLSTVEAPTR